MHAQTSIDPQHGELAALVEAYTQLVYSSARNDSALAPVALVSTGHRPSHVPLHWATVNLVATLSRTADEDGFAALLVTLQRLYAVPTLTVQQLSGLLALAVRTDDLVCAEANKLPLFIREDGSVRTHACGYSLRFTLDWWRVHLNTTTAHHLRLANALAQARALARPRRTRRFTIPTFEI